MRRSASACWPRFFIWLQERRIKSKPKARQNSWWAPLDWLPPLDTLERIAHATLEFGFPCMTVGLVIGSVLAQETPLGAAYFLDPKSHCLLRQLGSLRDAAAGAPQRRAARAQSSLSLRRGF